MCEFLVARGDVDPDRLCIRGGSAGGFTTLAALTFHEVFAAGASHYGVADLGVLAAGDPQVREPLPRRSGRSVARGPRHLRGALTDLPHRPHRPSARGVPGPRRPDRAAQPGRDDRRRAAHQGRAGGLPGLRGRAARLPPEPEHPSVPRRRAQLLRPGPRLRPSRRTRASSRSRSRTSDRRSGDPAEDHRVGGRRGRGRSRWRRRAASRARVEAGGVIEVELEERLARLDVVADGRPPRRRRRWGRRRPPCGRGPRRGARPRRRSPWRRAGRACRWRAP